MTIREFVGMLGELATVPGVTITEPVHCFLNVDAAGQLTDVSGNKVELRVAISNQPASKE